MSASNPLIGRLAAGVFFINLFVYALVGLSLYQSQQQYERQITLSTQNLAHSLEISITGIFNKMDVTLFALSKEAERQLVGGGINGKLLNAYIAQLHKQIPEFEAMWIAGEEGNVQFGTNIPASKPINIADREYFRRLYENPAAGMVISLPVIGRITKTWSVLIGRRINHPDGSFAGIAFGSLRVVDYFTKMFSTMDIGKHGIISLRDDGLALIAQYPPGWQIGSKVVSAKTLEIIRANPNSSSYTTVTKYDNVERTISYQKVTSYPFYIFVAQSKYEYLSPWRKEVAIALMLLALFTLFTLFSAWMFNIRTSEMLARHFLQRDRDNLDMKVKERTAELEALNQELEAFNYTVSHDLRRPLTVINGYCQLVQELYGNKLDERCRGYFREMYEGTLSMNQLIDTLLEFSHISRVEMHHEKVELSKMAGEVALGLKASEPGRRVTFRIAEGIMADGDAGLLQMVLDNLFGNAWKFTRNQTETVIEFGVTEIEGKQAFFVRDDGPGFDMAHADKLFRPFQRLPGTNVEGHGVGLATVERIIRRHGGRVWAAGEQAKGATFYFTLGGDRTN